MPFQFPVQYYSREGSSDKYLLLLHGYRLNARKALIDFEDMIPKEYNIIAPNGYFPIPKSDKHISRLGYSWYFEDHKTGKSAFSVKDATSNLAHFLNQLSLNDKDITVFGFSQGAVIGLSLVDVFTKIKNLVLLSTIPRLSVHKTDRKLNILALNGKEDEFMDFDLACIDYEQLKEYGHDVVFEGFAKIGHNLGPAASDLKPKIKQFLEETL